MLPLGHEEEGRTDAAGLRVSEQRVDFSWVMFLEVLTVEQELAGLYVFFCSVRALALMG